MSAYMTGASEPATHSCPADVSRSKTFNSWHVLAPCGNGGSALQHGWIVPAMLPSSTHQYVELVYPARVRVKMANPYATTASSRQDSSITEAMHPAYLKQDRHRQVASNPPSVGMAKNSVREQTRRTSSQCTDDQSGTATGVSFTIQQLFGALEDRLHHCRQCRRKVPEAVTAPPPEAVILGTGQQQSSNTLGRSSPMSTIADGSGSHSSGLGDPHLRRHWAPRELCH